MKYYRTLALIMALIIGLSIGNKDIISYAAHAEKELSYTNIYDTKTQRQIETQLKSAKIASGNVNRYMNYIKKYNKVYKKGIPVKKGYQSTSRQLPSYDIKKLAAIWRKATKMKYDDINCRVAAFTLLNKQISTTNRKVINKFDGNELEFDKDLIRDNPAVSFTKKEALKFHNLYTSFQVPEKSTPRQLEKLVQKEWRKRNIKFSKGKKASLITIFTYDWRVGNYCVDHAGVLLKVNRGYVFLEKYGPLYPFQASKFASKQDLYKYLVKRLDTGNGELSGRDVVMENDKPLVSVSSIKQEITNLSLKTNKKNNKGISIKYELVKRSNVKIQIYNSNNKLVAAYYEKSISPAEKQNFFWDYRVTRQNTLKKTAGSKAPKGTYYAKITAENTSLKTKNFNVK